MVWNICQVRATRVAQMSHALSPQEATPRPGLGKWDSLGNALEESGMLAACPTLGDEFSIPGGGKEEMASIKRQEGVK